MTGVQTCALPICFPVTIIEMKFPKGKIDDALDVFACHGVGGMVGMLLTGVFASKAVNPIVSRKARMTPGEISKTFSRSTDLRILVPANGNSNDKVSR